MKTVYATYQNSDLTEGRGPCVMRSVFANKEDAEWYNSNCIGGVMGTPNDCKIKEIIVFDSLDEVEGHRKLEIRKAALAKLTEEERKILLGS